MFYRPSIVFLLTSVVFPLSCSCLSIVLRCLSVVFRCCCRHRVAPYVTARGTPPHVTKIKRISDIQHFPRKKHQNFISILARSYIASTRNEFHHSPFVIHHSSFTIHHSPFVIRQISFVCAHTLDKCQEKAPFSDKSTESLQPSYRNPLPLHRRKGSRP